MSTFFFPNDKFAQSIEMETDGTNIYIPSWKDTNVFVLSGTSLNYASVSLPSGMSFGASSGLIDSNKNLWFCGYDKYLSEYSTPALNLLTTISLPSGAIYTGLAENNGYIYSLNSNGEINTVESGSLVSTNVSLTKGLGYTGFVSEGNNLYTVFGSDTGASLCISTMTSQLSGTTVYETTPYFSNTTISVASGNVCVGGYNVLSIDYPVGGLAYILSPTGTNFTSLILTDTSSNLINSYSFNGKVLTLSSQVSGGTDPTFISFEKTQTQLFVCNPSSNALQIFTYTNQTLTLSQTLSITNPTGVYFIPNNTYAFVTQGSTNEITVLINNTSVWSIVSPVLTNDNANGISIVSDTEFIAATTNGVNVYNFISNSWSLSSGITLGYTPTSLTIDNDGTTFCIGLSGTSESVLTSIENNVVENQVTWSGVAQSFSWFNEILSIYDSYNNNVQTYATLNSLQFKHTSPLPLYNPSVIGATAQYAQNIVIISNSTNSYFYENVWINSNFIKSIKYTGYSVYNGTSWTPSYDLSEYGWVTSITSDTSGNFWMATSDNYLVEVSNTGSFISSNPISPVSANLFPPLGIAKMLWMGSHLYGVSSIGAGIIQLI